MAVEVGDLVTADLLNLIANPPTVQLVQASSQTMTHNITTAITFATGSTVVDTDTYHSESSNNTRITPLRAGIYMVEGKVAFAALAPQDFLVLDCWLRLNGSTTVVGSSGRRAPFFNTADNDTEQTPNVVQTGVRYIEFNGSTDYVELLGVQTNTGNTAGATSVSGQFASQLALKYVREA